MAAEGMTAFTATTHVEVVLPNRSWTDEPAMRKIAELLVTEKVGELEEKVKREYEGDIGRIEIRVKEGEEWLT